MTSYDRLWAGSWIALCLGIADDNLTLKVIALLMMVLALIERWRQS